MTVLHQAVFDGVMSKPHLPQMQIAVAAVLQCLELGDCHDQIRINLTLLTRLLSEMQDFVVCSFPCRRGLLDSQM